MSTTYHLGCCFSLVLCMCCNLAMAEVAIDHNSTRSNRGTAVGGGGDTTDTDLAIGNDKIVRKKPGRTTYANVTLSAAGEADGTSAELAIGNDKIVRKKPGRTTYANVTLSAAGEADGTSAELAIGNDKIVRKKPGRTTYANVTLSAAGEAEAIEYGLIAALMDGDDDAMIEYALIVALLTEMEQAETGDCNDNNEQVRPSLAAGDGDLGGGNGNAGSGTLRNNDPIPGIDVIVDKDPVLNESLNNSPVMMLNEMLRAGYSQAEVVEFALATGLLGP